uniref:Beta-fructofuranosidase, insoluble isoenzyme 1 n=1 Tax=Daucus carota TaxID=4039 RepID=INV1_DAUCA|nr:RecName: Full=Beta-fructofuranosidase, insoluble isoenzyme 1; AltName: Full=Cell wall beta-fructosidase 1; AltName: Full=Invertase 1; AltName: Full=Sucrose hydrolase 1; Flags: Precursor [Daucus carota]AAA03516.1 beta-fructosidase [Daucus carota]
MGVTIRNRNYDHGSLPFLQSLLAILLVTTTTLHINGVEAFHEIHYNLQSVGAENVKQVHRTGYHFQPKQNWINDPNGPMYYKGVYHLFYQYNPKGAVWGNIVWAHSVSTDLINWTPLEPAIFPSKPFDKYGCRSGSATILPGNKPVILYTGIVEGPPKNVQVQNYAIPANLSDPYLRKWIKPDNNPLVVANNGENATAFRDPTTAWLDKSGHWKMLVGSKRNRRGIAYLYRSKDFIKWTKAKHPIHSQANTGMWECPDFFPVSLKGLNGLDTSVTGESVKHVLKVSLDLTRYEYYTVGTYLTDKDRYIPDNTSVDGWAGLRYDYGNFYASKTFFDPSKNRRILWGWANESDSTAHDVAKGWAGIQLIPRTLWLDPSGKQLMQWPIEELETLRGSKVKFSRKQDLSKGILVEVKGITAAQADVEVTFSFKSLAKREPFDPKWLEYDAEKICSLKGSTVQGGVGPFGLLTLASEKLEEYTPVFFRVFKAQNTHKVLMCSDATRSSLKEGLYRPSFAGFVDVDLATDKKISLRSLIDNSVVESFGAKGKTCISSRVYPTLAVYENAHLYVFNNGSETITVENLDAWSMKKPLRMN